jgi:hypothetical protein
MLICTEITSLNTIEIVQWVIRMILILAFPAYITKNKIQSSFRQFQTSNLLSSFLLLLLSYVIWLPPTLVFVIAFMCVDPNYILFSFIAIIVFYVVWFGMFEFIRNYKSNL